MTVEHLLTITAIIATSITTLIAPILSAWGTSRFSQPKPIPEPNQPKNQIQRRGGWIERVFLSKWFSWGQLLIIPYDIWAIYKELAKTTPLTRQSVLGVSVLVVVIVASFLNMHVLSFAQQNWKLIDLIGKLSDSILLGSGTDGKLLDLILRASESDEKKMLLLTARIEALEKPAIPKNKKSS